MEFVSISGGVGGGGARTSPGASARLAALTSRPLSPGGGGGGGGGGGVPGAPGGGDVAASSSAGSAAGGAGVAALAGVEASLALRIERVGRTWRSNMRRALAAGDREAYDRIRNQVSQLADWRQHKAALEASLRENGGATAAAGTAVASNTAAAGAAATAAAAAAASAVAAGAAAPGNGGNGGALEGGSAATAASSSLRLVAAVNESILNLVESSSTSRQAREGLISPRTSADEPAHEGNTGVIELLRLHLDSEKRVLSSARVPAAASEALAADVARGLHGGPTVSNERATDVSGLHSGAGDEAARALEPLAAEPSPLESVAAGLAFSRAPEAPHGLVQLCVELQAARALWELGQPAELVVCVWDALQHQFLSEPCVVRVDVRHCAGAACSCSTRRPPGWNRTRNARKLCSLRRRP